jgi:hypothetical protein
MKAVPGPGRRSRVAIQVATARQQQQLRSFAEDPFRLELATETPAGTNYTNSEVSDHADELPGIALIQKHRTYNHNRNAARYLDSPVRTLDSLWA